MTDENRDAGSHPPEIVDPVAEADPKTQHGYARRVRESLEENVEDPEVRGMMGLDNEAADVTEHDIWLTPHDMDHLRDGQPVFKGIGEDVLLVLRSASWDELEAMEEHDGPE